MRFGANPKESLYAIEAVEAEEDGAEVEGALAGDEEAGGEPVVGAVAALDEAEAEGGGEVFGDVGGGEAEAGGEFGDGEGVAFGEFVENAPAGAVGDGGEDGVPNDLSANAR